MKIENFLYKKISVDAVKINVAIGGSGLPVVLLHGFPETHLAWRHVAPQLAKDYTVICPDLRGYGESDKPTGDESHRMYSKRTMAADVVGLMHELGYDSFAVIGHDRGGLVAFRMVLDYPQKITHVGVLDIIPTIDMWPSLQGIFGVFSYHMFFLAQPNVLPEKMLAASAKDFLYHTLDSWNKTPGAFPNDIREQYLASFSHPEAIHAICEDYRSGAFEDGKDDTADRHAGKKIRAPLLALWQDPAGMELPFDPLAIWQSWAPDVTGRALACGHFLPEERPDDVVAAIREHLER